jgi:hypothetical protein
MAMPAVQRTKRTTSPPAPAPAVTSTSVAVADSPTAGTPERPLRPLLVVAGIVAAVATFCLLLLATRAEGTDTAPR